MAADIKLGERIRIRRQKCNMTQQDLAAVLGISFQQVQKYEKGTNRVNANRLALIASALKMGPEDFYQSDDMLQNVSSLINVTNKSTLRMLQAYSRIKDQATQRKMVELLEKIADAQKSK